MGKVTMYRDDETEQTMIANPRALNFLASEWIANLVCERLVDNWRRRRSYPLGVLPEPCRESRFLQVAGSQRHHALCCLNLGGQ